MRPLRNCLISSNSAALYSGGGIRTYWSGTAENCTITRNTARQSGGGLYCYWGFTVRNCVVWSNTAGAGANIYETGSASSYGYTCTEPAVSGAGNISIAPRFVDAELGDYRLAEGSPCIDEGTNMTWMTASTDLDGNNRIIRGTVDIGAYEFVVPGGNVIVVK